MLLRQVRILHRGPQISVPHGFLDVNRILLFRQPSGDTPVSQVVLNKLRRQLGPLASGLERTVERPDPRSGLVMSP